jgi:hypothetical protein
MSPLRYFPVPYVLLHLLFFVVRLALLKHFLVIISFLFLVQFYYRYFKGSFCGSVSDTTSVNNRSLTYLLRDALSPVQSM